MKNSKKLLLALLLLCLPLAPVVFSTGCKTTQEQVAYKSLKVTWDTVHRAMLVYGELYREGKVPPETHAKVVAIHKRYRASMAIAIDAAQLDWSAPTSAELTALATQLCSLISQAKP